MRVIVDTREPVIVQKLLAEHYDVVERKTLDYGDILGEKVIVERKSVNDLVQSTFTGRLEQQALGLQVFADDRELLPIVLVHGFAADVEPYVLGAHKIIAGQLASLKVRYGFEIVWSPTLNDGLAIVAAIDKKILEGKLGNPRKPRARNRSVDERQAAIIATLFRLPMNSARVIVERGGLRFLLTATDEQLLSIPGIGKKTLRRIRTWLGDR